MEVVVVQVHRASSVELCTTQIVFDALDAPPTPTYSIAGCATGKKSLSRLLFGAAAPLNRPGLPTLLQSMMGPQLAYISTDPLGAKQLQTCLLWQAA